MNWKALWPLPSALFLLQSHCSQIIQTEMLSFCGEIFVHFCSKQFIIDSIFEGFSHGCLVCIRCASILPNVRFQRCGFFRVGFVFHLKYLDTGWNTAQLQEHREREIKFDFAIKKIETWTKLILIVLQVQCSKFVSLRDEIVMFNYRTWERLSPE